jgi:hypothetical protein
MSSWKEEMLQREEPLEKKLHSYLEWHHILGPMLKHPLYVSYCDPERAALVNFTIEQSQSQINRMISKKNWYQAVFMHETAFSFRCLSAVHRSVRRQKLLADSLSGLDATGTVVAEPKAVSPAIPVSTPPTTVPHDDGRALKA